MAVPAEEVAAVHQGQEALALAIGVGHVLKEPQAVQDVRLRPLVVGQHLGMGDAKPWQEAGMLRPGLPRQLRLDVDRLRAVHGPGADAQHHAAEARHGLPQVNLLEEAVLGQGGPAREDDEVGGFHQLRRHLRVPVDQDAPQGHREAGVLKGREHLPGEAVREGEVVRVRADEESTGGPGQDLLQLRDKAVGGVQVGVVLPHRRAAGQKRDHSETSFLRSFFVPILSPPPSPGQAPWPGTVRRRKAAPPKRRGCLGFPFRYSS